MIGKEDRWLNQTGLNLIRIIIGSYFAAIALDLVIGVDQKAMFLLFLPVHVADFVSATLLSVARDQVDINLFANI